MEVAHNTNTHVTYGVCFGNDSQDGNLFLDQLKAARGYAMHPCLSLLLATNLFLTHLEGLVDELFHDFEPLPTAIGTEHYRGRFAGIKPRENFDKLPRRLTALADASAILSLGLSAMTDLFNFLNRQLEDFKGVGAGFRVEEDLRAQLALKRSKLEGMGWNNKATKEAVQAQVQLVCWLVIFQLSSNFEMHSARFVYDCISICIQSPTYCLPTQY